MSSSRGSSWPRDWAVASYVSCIGRRVLYHQRSPCWVRCPKVFPKSVVSCRRPVPHDDWTAKGTWQQEGWPWEHTLERLRTGLCAPGGERWWPGFLPAAHRGCPLAKELWAPRPQSTFRQAAATQDSFPVCVLVCCPASLSGILFHTGAGPLITPGYCISDVTFNGFGV